MASVPKSSSQSGMDEEMGVAEEGGKNDGNTLTVKGSDTASSVSKSDNRGLIVNIENSTGSVFADGNGRNNGNSNNIEDQIRKLEEELGFADAEDNGTYPTPAKTAFVESTIVENAFAENTILDPSKKDDESADDGYEWNNDGHMEIIEENISAIKRLEKRIQELEKRKGTESLEDLDKKYPKDAYSFIALNGPDEVGMPNKTNWPLQKRFFFFFSDLLFSQFSAFFSLC